MEMYVHVVEPYELCGVEGTKYCFGIPFLKYLYTEVFNNEPGAKEVYEELAAKVDSENEAIYYATINQISAYRILRTASDLIGDYIAGLLRRRFGPFLDKSKLTRGQIPASVYASYLHNLGVRCLKMNFDYAEHEIISNEDFNNVCFIDLWCRCTLNII